MSCGLLKWLYDLYIDYKHTDICMNSYLIHKKTIILLRYHLSGISISRIPLLEQIDSTNCLKYQFIIFPVNVGIRKNVRNHSHYRILYRKYSHFKPNSFTFPTVLVGIEFEFFYSRP